MAWLHITNTCIPIQPIHVYRSCNLLLSGISDRGSVVALQSVPSNVGYSEALAESFPEYTSELQSIIERLWDQLTILRKHYEHPDFCGSKSLKTVLPVLVPSLSYKTLDIQEGGDAPAVWNMMLSANSETERQEWHRTFESLLQTRYPCYG